MPKPRVKAQRELDAKPIWWPKDVAAFFDLSTPSRLRWEHEKKLPPRDVYVNGRAVAWRRETIINSTRDPASATAANTSP